MILFDKDNGYNPYFIFLVMIKEKCTYDEAVKLVEIEFKTK